MIRKNKKNLFLMIFVIVTTLSTIGAYFTAYAMKNNIFTIGEICHDWQYLSEQEHLCSKCNAKEAHTYTTTKEATCTVDGSKECSKCSHVESIPKLGHTWTEINDEHICNRCKSSETHTWLTDGDHYSCSRCQAKKYKIIYNLSGGKLPDDAPSEYVSSIGLASLPIPTYDNYSFKGWTGSNGTIAQRDVTITKGSTGNKSYTANWIEKSKTLETGKIFNSKIPNLVTTVTFTDEKAPNNASLINLAEDGNNGIVGWVEGSTFKVSTQIAGQKVKANQNCSNMFKGKTNLIAINFKAFDTSNTNTMQYMFSNCIKLKELDLNCFNTVKCSTFESMFSGCSKLEELNLSSLDNDSYSNVKTYKMFLDCIKLQRVTVGDKFLWKSGGYLPTPSATYIPDADGTWYNENTKAQYNPTELPSYKAATYIAYKPKSRKLINGSAFKEKIPDSTTTIVFTDGKAPEGTITFNLGDDGKNGVVGWVEGTALFVSTQAKGVKIIANEDCRNMFDNKRSLKSVDFKNLDFSKVVDLSYSFRDCRDLQAIDLSGKDLSNVKSMCSMFQNCGSLQNINLSGADLRGMESMNYLADNNDCAGNAYWMIRDCDKLQNINLSGADLSNVTDMSHMFYSSSLQSIDLSRADLSNVTDMSHMFYSSSLQNINLSGTDLSNVTDMQYMFQSCNNLQSIDLSGIDLSSVTNMGQMFTNCSRLQSVDLSGKCSSKVTNMRWIFADCSNLQTIDLSGFSGVNLSNITDMRQMFDSCNNLFKVKLGEKSNKIASNLPTPTSTYISGADGKWYNEATGVGYAPEEIPDNVAATYVASPNLIKKN